MTSNEQILILGNSHMLAFDRQFRKRLKRMDSAPTVHSVYTNFLVTPWRETDKNDNLHQLEFDEGFGHPIDLRPHRGKLHLVIMGAGVLGSGLLNFFKQIETVPTGEEHKAPQYTPRVAKLLGVKLDAPPSHTTYPVHPWAMAIAYRILWWRRIACLKSILNSGEFQTVSWVVEPDMIEAVARVRFGDGLVESGLYDHHRRLASRVFTKLIYRQGWQDIFMLHPDHQRAKSGFTQSEYAFSIAKTDVHTSPGYYAQSVDAVCDRIFGLESGLPSKAAS